MYHAILLSKLIALGFSNQAVSWVRSYLSERKQIVDVGGISSQPKVLECGVPQGSVLGPVFFLLYINDLISACSCNLFLYADDSALLVSHKDKNEVENMLSAELLNVSRWLADNKLSLHLGKTEAILFGSLAKLRKSSVFKVRVGGTEITAKETINYLGCILDNHLTGVNMAQKVLTKINQRIRFISRISRFLDKRALQTLAGALVQSLFDYACTSWYSSTHKKLKNKLQTSQNKLVRLVLKLPARAHLESSHFARLGWLKVDDRVSMIKLCLVKRIVQGEVPKYLCNYFNSIRDHHQYSTRGSSTDFIPYKFKSMMGKESFLYSAAKQWNSLPKQIKTLPSLATFKKQVKKWLLDN